MFPRVLIAPSPLARALRILYGSEQTRRSSDPGHGSFPQEVQLREETLEGGGRGPMYFDVLGSTPWIVARTFERVYEVEQWSPHPVLIVTLSSL